MGTGAFQDVAADAGINDIRQGHAAVVCDYDADGLSDIFVANYLDPNSLYRNLGVSTFVDVAPTLGLDNSGQSYAIAAFDFTVVARDMSSYGRLICTPALTVIAADPSATATAR